MSHRLLSRRLKINLEIERTPEFGDGVMSSKSLSIRVESPDKPPHFTPPQPPDGVAARYKRLFCFFPKAGGEEKSEENTRLNDCGPAGGRRGQKATVGAF
ncbi:hypothetical protein EYF80_014633 [Liparis tanakae]|uniref:Uncharacterized protein n=1 Tax=Liparis tanakae TaxID=230148 RepID=A0A4Z2IDZ5_9TELE|nr:hypothetical protein EYF80_014633 [Liparis tanakae]